jgi:hypothetical protein
LFFLPVQKISSSKKTIKNQKAVRLISLGTKIAQFLSLILKQYFTEIRTQSEERLMRKKALFIMIVGFFVISLAGVSHGWQGRMAGMGDPFGLVQDESDFLIHPSGMADGKGINFYGNYRFNWRDVTDWNYSSTVFNPVTGGLMETWPYRGSGDDYEHNGLLGTAFPLGPGRMGFFFEYAGKRDDYDGDQPNRSPSTFWYHTYRLESDLDTFALRLLYGIPMGGFKLGGEVQLAYRQEENETFLNEDVSPGIHTLRLFHTNFPLAGTEPWVNLLPFMTPYDSKYWEALFKGSLEGKIGPAKIAFTIRGGFIFSGGNKYNATTIFPAGAPDFIKTDGDVKGWRIGEDLWLRVPLSEGISLPFLVKADYQKKTRDEDGIGSGFIPFPNVDYTNEEKILQIEAGGGIDKELGKGTRIAAGIYYSYIQNKNNFDVTWFQGVNWIDAGYSNYPDHRENQVILKLAGEKELSPIVDLRMGINFFYGWAEENFRYNLRTSASPFVSVSHASLDGYHWGLGASMGGTVKFDRFSLEPFIAVGYQKMNLKGDGFETVYIPGILQGDKARKEWSLGGGVSIKF